MTISRKLALGAFALTTIGGLGVAGSASAATQHCALKTDPSKVELSYETKSIGGFRPGSTVCIKAGNQAQEVEADENGFITSFNGKGISYYVCQDSYGCEPGGGSIS